MMVDFTSFGRQKNKNYTQHCISVMRAKVLKLSELIFNEHIT